MSIDGKSDPALVFDFGGVLMDWNPRHLYEKFFGGDREAVEKFLDETGFYSWNHRLDMGHPFSGVIEEISSRYPTYRELILAYDRRWEETLSGSIQPTVDLLRRLKEAGHSLYALSNWSAEKFASVRHKYDFFGWFEDIVISGEVGVAKPDERIFAFTLDRIGRTAGECLFIDDSAPNIAAAERLGFQTIHFQTPELLQAELHRRGLLAVTP